MQTLPRVSVCLWYRTCAPNLSPSNPSPQLSTSLSCDSITKFLVLTSCQPHINSSLSHQRLIISCVTNFASSKERLWSIALARRTIISVTIFNADQRGRPPAVLWTLPPRIGYLDGRFTKENGEVWEYGGYIHFLTDARVNQTHVAMPRLHYSIA